jgi:hypothetical protein
MFHLLRRQMLRKQRKPLVVFAPKSPLRMKETMSHVDALTAGSFAEVLDDPFVTDRAAVQRRTLLTMRTAQVPAQAAFAGVVAGCAAVAAYALPLKMNILVAIAAAVAIGVLMDHAAPKKPAIAKPVAPPPAPGGPEDRS